MPIDSSLVGVEEAALGVVAPGVNIGPVLFAEVLGSERGKPGRFHLCTDLLQRLVCRPIAESHVRTFA